MPKKKTLSKAAFVRSLSAGLSAKDVVAEAKKKGISISEAHIYGIRAAAKKKSGKSTGGAKRGPGRPAGSGSIESKFLSLVLDVGLVRAQKLLQDVRARVHD